MYRSLSISFHCVLVCHIELISCLSTSLEYLNHLLEQKTMLFSNKTTTSNFDIMIIENLTGGNNKEPAVSIVFSVYSWTECESTGQW